MNAVCLALLAAEIARGIVVEQWEAASWQPTLEIEIGARTGNARKPRTSRENTIQVGKIQYFKVIDGVTKAENCPA